MIWKASLLPVVMFMVIDLQDLGFIPPVTIIFFFMNIINHVNYLGFLHE